MLSRMLVPLDGSELAETVCVYAKELAGRLDMDIILLHVSTPARGDVVPMELAYIDHVAERLRRQIKEVQSAGSDGKKPVKVTSELAVGYAPDEILRFAEEHGIDLILLASHGRSGVKRWTVGSVASKVMGATRIPVWLIKAGAEQETPYDKWPSETLVVTLDGSELAESVLPYAEALAKQHASKPVELVLVRVAEPMNIPTYYSPDISGVSLNWGNIAQQETIRRKQAAKEYLAKVEGKLKEKGISVKSVVVEGRANDEVVDYVNKIPNSMVIVASHGRSGLGRLFYGSVAANIIHGVTRPIFLIKAQ